MTFYHLTQTGISEIKQAFADAKMHYDRELRTLLLHGINYQYVESLTDFSSDQRQLTADLNSLNAVERLEDGSVPLREWLTNARDQFQPLEQVQVFVAVLEQMARREKITPHLPPSDTDAIVEGLEALSVLIRKSQPAYDAFVIYGHAFQTALDDIDVIADYKLLHEQLHGLQLAWPDDIAETLKDLAEDPKAQMELRKHSENLIGTLSRQREIFAKGNVDRCEGDWINDFTKSQKQLEEWLNTLAGTEIEKTFDQIRGDLSLRLFKLNERLRDAITELRLKDLIAAMKKLCEALKLISDERLSGKIQQYWEGIVQLDLLNSEIAKLIEQHDLWQGAISRLQMLTEQLEGASTLEDQKAAAMLKGPMLTITVDTIEKKIEPLHRGWTTGWAAEMNKSIDVLRKAVREEKLVDKAERWFLTYRDQASQLFFGLDIEMKNRSEELRRIGDQLRIVNKELD